MKKKMFILIEAVLAVLVVALMFVVLQGKNEKELDKVSVIIQNSDDNQWAAFKYGLKMAAEDQGIEMFVVSTEGTLTAEEEMQLIESELAHGADAVIVQPVFGNDIEKMLKKIQKKVPVMLVESTASKEKDESLLPTVEPDHYEMGKVLVEELLKDYSGKLDGKTVGIISEAKETESAENRERGVMDVLKDTGAKISWSVSGSFAEGEKLLETQTKVDFVIALDDASLTTVGQCSAANNLHGAIVYGIGNSTEAAYYLDTGIVECLVVPDEFNIGYQSLTEVAEAIRNPFRKMQNREISHTVIRRDTLFSEENQEILFTMIQ